MIKLLEHRTPMKEVVLTEGPGAGYKIEARDFNLSGIIKDISVSKIGGGNYQLYADYRLYCKCDLQGTLGSMSAESYYYSTGEIQNVPVECSEFILELSSDELKEYIIDKLLEDVPEASSENFDITSIDDNDISLYIDKEMLLDDIDANIGSAISDYVYGGGYMHSTYDGTITDINEGGSSHVGNWLESSGFMGITANIFINDDTDFGKWVIQFVDLAVTGENYEEGYYVVSEYDDVEDAFGDDEEGAAIEYAQEYGYPKVDKVKYYYDINQEPIDWGYERETVWEAEEE